MVLNNKKTAPRSFQNRIEKTDWNGFEVILMVRKSTSYYDVAKHHYLSKNIKNNFLQHKDWR